MPVIRLETRIHSPIERCFDLARSVEAHTASTARTRERAVGGRTSGLLGAGDVVTWEAVHFGIKQRLTARVTRCECPHVFEDVLVRGAFASFTHTHVFRVDGNLTLMIDTFRYRCPLGVLGSVADILFLKRYMTAFLRNRADYLKQLAESDSPGDDTLPKCPRRRQG